MSELSQGWAEPGQPWELLGSLGERRHSADPALLRVGLAQIASADDVVALPARGGDKPEQERAAKSAVH